MDILIVALLMIFFAVLIVIINFSIMAKEEKKIAYKEKLDAELLEVRILERAMALEREAKFKESRVVDTDKARAERQERMENRFRGGMGNGVVGGFTSEPIVKPTISTPKPQDKPTRRMYQSRSTSNTPYSGYYEDENYSKNDSNSYDSNSCDRSGNDSSSSYDSSSSSSDSGGSSDW